MYRFKSWKGDLSPIIVSSPHSGTIFPDELAQEYLKEVIFSPVDTDWFIDELYSFAPSLGMSFISAKYSRFVVDLNRDPIGKKLYSDGRKETSVVPISSFSGENILKNRDATITSSEIMRRLDDYYWPYYKKIEFELSKLKNEFEQVLLFDAHSIKSVVPSIQKNKFPQIILGNQDGKCCDLRIISFAAEFLRSKGWEVAINTPFKGGHITRYFASPTEGVHALQLEMIQENYMDEDTGVKKAVKFQRLMYELEELFVGLSCLIKGLSRE